VRHPHPHPNIALTLTLTLTRRDYAEAFHSQKGKKGQALTKAAHTPKKALRLPPPKPKRKSEQASQQSQRQGGRPTKKLKLK
jgi:hypothetical protein